jgi:uracil DNA glycosylase
MAAEKQRKVMRHTPNRLSLFYKCMIETCQSTKIALVAGQDPSKNFMAIHGSDMKKKLTEVVPRSLSACS